MNDSWVSDDVAWVFDADQLVIALAITGIPCSKASPTGSGSFFTGLLNDEGYFLPSISSGELSSSLVRLLKVSEQIDSASESPDNPGTS